MSKKVKKGRKVVKRRRSGFGACVTVGKKTSCAFGKRLRPGVPVGYGPGIRRPKVSKKVAMKAFKSFYQRHCAGARRSRFGNGGNPPLYASMGYEFCPSGNGGVLGSNSTGLFPSPCQSNAAGSVAPLASAYGSLYKRAKARAKAVYKKGKSKGKALLARVRRRRSVKHLNAVGKQHAMAAQAFGRRW